jgi:hypothetical protein
MVRAGGYGTHDRAHTNMRDGELGQRSAPFGTSTLRTTTTSWADTACIMGAENTAKVVFHLHGGHVPTAIDGYPELSFTPGAAPVTYVIRTTSRRISLYAMLGVTRLNVYMGLAGLYLVRDATESALNLPTGQYEVPLVIQDRKFNSNGTLQYPATWQDHFFGDKILVNGKVWPYFDVKRGKYRFRLLNGSTSDLHALPPASERTLTFTVIGTEGGLLEAPAHGVGSLRSAREALRRRRGLRGLRRGQEILLPEQRGGAVPNGPLDVVTHEVPRDAARRGHGPVPVTARDRGLDPADRRDARSTAQALGR